jgi:hypothetical protein
MDGISKDYLRRSASVGQFRSADLPGGRKLGLQIFCRWQSRRHRVPPPSPFACTVERRPALFKVKARLCDGEPPLARVRRTRLLESHFGKNLAEISIVTGLHCHIPIPKTHCAR